jgi:hypothetical protein
MRADDIWPLRRMRSIKPAAHGFGVRWTSAEYCSAQENQEEPNQ